MKPRTFIPVLIATAALSAAAGFYFARQQAQPSPTTPPTEGSQPEAAPPAISPEELAKSKDVPSEIKNPQGDYQLLAVIETAETNRQLTQSLDVVNQQRQQLASLMGQYDQTPDTSPQERELIAGKINELRQALESNLRFMSQNFAYSLNYNYILVPHHATLIAITEKEGKVQKKTAYEFTSAATYEAWQEKREAYFRLQQAQKEAAVEPAGEPASEPAAVPVPAPDTPEMKELRAELLRRFNYSPDKTYQIDFNKTAIYARQA